MQSSSSAIIIRGGGYARRVTGGWCRYVHINGGVYYYHEQYRIITDNDMEDLRWREVVEAAWREFKRECRRDKSAEYILDDADVIIRYYLGFWSNDNIPDFDDTPEVLVVSLREGTETRFLDEEGRDVVIEFGTYRFWTQVEEYPMHISGEDILPRARAAFLDAMTFIANERIYDNKACMIPFTLSQVERFMEIYRDLSEIAERISAVMTVLVWFLARVVREVKAVQEGFAMQCAAKDLEILGYAIRRSDLSSPACKTWQLRLASYLCGTLLLGSQSAYEIRLQGTRWGSGVHLEAFRRAVGQCLAEWRDSNLLATVFVGANIALLSIPNISGITRTGATSSAMFSVLSVSSGLYHVWNHRSKMTADALEAAKYVYHVQGRTGKGSSDLSDPVIMSCFLALPVASMMWALLCLFVALAAFGIEANAPTRSDTAFWVLSAALSTAILVGALVVAHSTRVHWHSVTRVQSYIGVGESLD